MKIITNPIEIYKNVEIGCMINVGGCNYKKSMGYWSLNYEKDKYKTTTGIVTSIVNCSVFKGCRNEGVCSGIKIGIDEFLPSCFMFSGRCGIVSIIIDGFFTEEEFKIL